MSAFLYWIDDHHAPVTRARLADWALAEIFDGVPYHAALNQRGPGGRPGTLLCDEPRMKPHLPRLDLDNQTWIRRVESRESRVESPTVWVGLWKGSRPGPAELARGELIPGETLKLADERPWQVPRARIVAEAASTPHAPCSTRYESVPAVPRYVAIDEYGNPIPGRVVEKYAPLLSTVEPWWNAFLAAIEAAAAEGRDSFVVDHPHVIQDAARVLGFNYRLGLAEVALLELFATDGTAMRVMEESCTAQLAMLLVQKKTPQPESPSSGTPTSAGDAA